MYLLRLKEFQNYSLNTSSIINEVFIAIIIAVFAVMISQNNNVSQKKYQKLYILSVHFILILLNIINISTLTITLILFMILFLGGVNQLYEADGLEKELGILSLLYFSFFKWFFQIKGYLFFVDIVLLALHKEFNIILKKTSSFTPSINIKNFEIQAIDTKVESYLFLLLCIYVIFIFYHLISNAKDKFGVIGFESFSEKNRISKQIVPAMSEDIEKYADYFTDILLKEDKDFIRKQKIMFNFNVYTQRKINEFKVLKDTVEYEKNLGCKVFKKLSSCLNKKNIIRGRAGISQQLVRTQCMNQDSYKYTIRRKLFVEWIYCPMYYKAKANQIYFYYEKPKGLKKIVAKLFGKVDKSIYPLLKMEILISYHFYVLDNPQSMRDLTEKLSIQSKNNRMKHFYEEEKKEMKKEVKYLLTNTINDTYFN